MKKAYVSTLMVIFFPQYWSLSVMPGQAAVILEQDAAVRPISREASSSQAHPQAAVLRPRLEPRISLRRKSTLCPGRRRLIKSESYSGYSPPRPREFPGRGAAREQTVQVDVARVTPSRHQLLVRVLSLLKNRRRVYR